jgi:type II secretory pathway component PulF
LDALVHAFVAVLATCAALGFAFTLGAILIALDRRRGGGIAPRFDALKLRLPFLSRFFVAKEMLSISFAMATLTSAGMGVEEALRECRGATGNAALRAALEEVRSAVLRGESLSEGFSRARHFPPRIGQWAGIGERAGHVERVFGQLRAYYQQEVDKWTQRLATAIEPALIVVLGVLMVLFVVFFVVPIFSLYAGML